jgi:dolichyl-phosphate-mannose-protein mannosyltransferase
VLLAMLVLAVLWSWREVRRELPTLVAAFLVLPSLVYAATFLGVIHHPLLAPPWDGHSWWRIFVNRQEYMLRFHAGLGGTHPYESPPWSWLLDKRPIVYHLERDGTTVREVLALGNPLVWWPGIAAVLVQAAAWARSRSSRHPGAVIVTLVVVGYLPWLVLAHGREFVFLFYVLPTVPFLCLALGACAAALQRLTLGRPAIVAAAAVILASFVFAYPILANRSLTYDQFRQRILFTDCGTPGKDGSVVLARAGTRTLTVPKPGAGRPPDGWCWL